MSFKLRKAHFDGREIPLWFLDNDDSNDENKNRCTILIGKNGVGKSRMLGQICQTFNVLSARQARLYSSNSKTKPLYPNENFKLEYNIRGHTVSLVFPEEKVLAEIDGKQERLYKQFLPTRVIATTITPFDKFPISFVPNSVESDDINHESHPNIYKYQGARNRTGQMSHTAWVYRVVESLMFSSEKGRDSMNRMHRVFTFLGYDSRISVAFTHKISKKIIDDFRTIVLPDESFEKAKLAFIGNVLSKNIRSRTQADALQKRLIEDKKFVEEILEALVEVLNLVSHLRVVAKYGRIG